MSRGFTVAALWVPFSFLISPLCLESSQLSFSNEITAESSSSATDELFEPRLDLERRINPATTQHPRSDYMSGNMLLWHTKTQT